MKKNNTKKIRVQKKEDNFGGDWKVSYGNDSELLLYDVEKKRVVSAIPVLKHDKHDPINLGDGIQLYWDNVLLETSYPPYYSKQEMFERFHNVFQKIQDYIGPKYRMIPQAAHFYDAEDLNDPNAHLIGCSPSFDAYSVSIIKRDGFPSNIRTSGHHIHLGNPKLTDFDTRIETIKLMDIFVGLPAVIYNNDKSEVDRRKLYGDSGDHRPTEWGLEYRPLSSAVLCSKEMVDLNFDLINYTLEYVRNNTINNVLKLLDEKDIRRAIKTCDKTLAIDLLKKINLPKELFERIEKLSQKVFTPEDFYKSWNIKI